MPTFGARLQRLRMEKGLSQEELAGRFKISKSAVGMYERNEREPSFELIRRFAEFFNVSYNHLLGQSDEATVADSEELYKDLDPELVEALKNASPENREHFHKYLRGEVSEPVFYTQTEKALTRDLENGMDILELMEKYTFTIGGIEPTREELEQAMKYIKASRIMNMM